MDFVWNDGGRSACGFVGTTGDCVTRAIAVATGRNYRDVYDELGKRSLKSPRNGVPVDVANAYLDARDWQSKSVTKDMRFVPQLLPKGVVIAYLTDTRGKQGHICTVIDHVIHDTWNATEDGCYYIRQYWTAPQGTFEEQALRAGPKRQVSAQQDLTQREFDKIMRRLRALDNTAQNTGSTEGEKRNALRMMQSLMLTHNLSREDIVDEDNVESVHFARMACPLNGKRAYTWEKMLAFYLTQEIFPHVQWYMSTKGHRTLFWFYGPLSDVENIIALFRELLLTIASAAKLQYGSYVRGSGASYAEGYVSGLPTNAETEEATPNESVVSNRALIHARTLAVHGAAKEWLANECNTRLTSGSGRGRHQHDEHAAQRGKKHGAKHQIQGGQRRKGLPHS